MTSKYANSYNLWNKIVFVYVLLVLISFSTDVRLGLNLKIGSQPDFQCFELINLILGVIFVICSPYFILHYKIHIAREDLFISLFVCYAFIMSIFAKDQIHSLSRSKDFLVSFFMYAILRYGPLRSDQVKRILYIVYIIGACWAFLGIIQFMGLDTQFGGNIYKLFLAEQAFKTKSVVDVSSGDIVHTSFAHGLYLFPQNFVYYLLFPFAISIAYAQEKPILWSITGVFAVAIVGTLSKTFILLFAIWSCIYCAFKYIRNSIVVALTLITAFCLIVFFIISFGHVSYWLESLGTFIWRVHIWQDTFSMLIAKPYILFIGHGTEWLRDLFSRENYPNPHNMLLYFLIEFGVVGFVLFFSFLWLSVNKLLHAVRPNKRHYKFLTYALIFFICMGVVDDIFVQTQLDGIFFFYIGLLMKIRDVTIREDFGFYRGV